MAPFRVVNTYTKRGRLSSPYKDRESTANEVALVGALATILGAISGWPWSMVGSGIGIATLSVIVYVNFIRPRQRKKRLENPVNAYFVVPQNHDHECEYATQDDEEHRVKEIFLPPHSEVTVDLVFDPNLSFSSNVVIFGCVGAADRKPHAVAYLNRFIKIGRGQRVDPKDESSDHFIDKRHHYHVRGARAWSIGTSAAFGFQIRTADCGTYPVEISFTGDEIGGGTHLLKITVSDSRKDTLRCIRPEHRNRGCSSSGISQPVPRPSN